MKAVRLRGSTSDKIVTNAFLHSEISDITLDHSWRKVNLYSPIFKGTLK